MLLLVTEFYNYNLLSLSFLKPFPLLFKQHSFNQIPLICSQRFNVLIIHVTKIQNKNKSSLLKLYFFVFTSLVIYFCLVGCF